MQWRGGVCTFAHSLIHEAVRKRTFSLQYYLLRAACVLWCLHAWCCSMRAACYSACTHGAAACGVRQASRTRSRPVLGRCTPRRVFFVPFSLLERVPIRSVRLPCFRWQSCCLCLPYSLGAVFGVLVLFAAVVPLRRPSTALLCSGVPWSSSLLGLSISMPRTKKTFVHTYFCLP